MKKIGCAVLAMLPLTALAYPIEVEKTLNGTEVSYDTQDIGDRMGAILLHNHGEKSVTCTAVFVNGPETPHVRKATLEPGKDANMASSFSRAVIKLRIKLTCTPA
ncbi:3-phosphoglycerate kinase [Pseudomonas sp. SCB32]|uniref:3-phosphoglycerate kinase n=1 Tax=Pseudomonas sp. SCB32 TaxID=2653853 RepID=UPI0012640BC7|nr:3-phosphoglycerate kinase [Pseudomonas sp. SCB32]